ncbi:MAG: NADH-quinone oxidoreductase subunit C [Magnetococcus sp. YQC-5]
MTRLRDDPELDFKQMIDLAGVHYPDQDPPFMVVYQLLSVHKNHRLRIKVKTGEGSLIPSVIQIWSCADWYEREAYDMFGILFTGHPDLRRILNDYDFEGHPLRKDFPVVGQFEVRYDETKERLVREPVRLEREDREPYRRSL